ncbi:MAG: HAMP domain-containing histidine kinase [Acetatifactor sp.]|nr:HAMP domain-containing histidine kinase [Acetatifactor sp.]
MNEPILFRAVQRRLTLLCSCITVSILCLFSLFYLFLAERTLWESQWSAFRQDMINFSRSLEQQAVITHVYLSSLEQNSNYQIYLWDQGIPFRFNSQSHHTFTPELLETLLTRLPSDETISDTPLFSEERLTPLPAGEECTLFSSGENWVLLKLQTGNGEDYQVYLTRLTIGQPSGAQLLTGSCQPGVTLLVAAPLQEMHHKLRQQRVRFLLLDLAGILMLTAFAGIFTRRMLRPLRESHERQTRFIADASHELRTPLAVIRACMHARPSGYEQTIDQECARMGRLIEDLLTLSRLDLGAQLQKQQDVDLDTLLLTIYEQMELLAAQKNIRLELNLPQEALPHVRGDLNRLEQLLNILLQNALSYTPVGGRIIMEAGVSPRNPSAVHIQVIDNGPGISDQDKAHIFERFYRAERSHTDRSHFGLGLCIAQEIAQAHGTVLTVTDTVGGGATFGFTLR